MKKRVMNIRPQEVTENGERTVQYKGSDGKMHSVASDGGGGSTALSVEEVTHTVELSLADSSSNLSIADFIMRYGAMKLTGYRIVSLRYNTSSVNKIYFDNGVQGPSPYRYNLSSTKVTFENGYDVVDEIDRDTFNTDAAAAKDFFERTIMSVIDELTPYMLYYFMLKANFIVVRSEFTGTMKHLVGTDKDGTRHDYGVIYPIYQL